MSTVHETSFAWLNAYVFLVSLVQILFVGYRWRERTRRLPLSILSGAVIAALWGAVFFFPFEYTTTVQLPKGQSAAAPTPNVDMIVRLVSAAVITCLVVGLNQLLLLGVRAGLSWKRA